MRVTAVQRGETLANIVCVSRKLFIRKGFDETTTRDIAREAGIGVGTLFNYFPNKEGIAVTLIHGAVGNLGAEYLGGRRGDEGPDEDLFAHALAGIRRMEGMRGWLGAVIEAAFSPLARSGGQDGDSLRVGHLETVTRLLQVHGLEAAVSAVTAHLYWTLYLGVLSFWARDASPQQVDTLVLLDQSMRLFVASLKAQPVRQGVDDEPAIG